MNILITGGAGFIGSTLADRLLNEGHYIIVADNMNEFYSKKIKKSNISHNHNNKNYKFYRADIEDRRQSKRIFKENKIDCVVHLAARAGVRPSLEQPELYKRTNFLGTQNLLNLSRHFGVKKFVFASSSSVYGNCEEPIFSESFSEYKPISPYAMTKISGEHLCESYARLYNINTTCLRFFTAYGPRQRPDLAINKFATLIKQDKEIPVFGDGTTFRDYTYVDDIVDGIIRAMHYNKNIFDVFNIGGGNPVTLNNLVKTIEAALGKEAKINRLPMQEGDVNKTIADVSKAKELLGFETKTSFDVGIKKFLEWQEEFEKQNITKKKWFNLF